MKRIASKLAGPLSLLVLVVLPFVALSALADKPPGDKPAAEQKKVQKDEAAKPDVTKEDEARVASIYGTTPYLVEKIEINDEIDESTVTQIKTQVAAINDNERVKAVVLVLNSPGGGAAASAASYEELSKLKVPAVAWCDQMCASGAYYIAMSPAVKYMMVRREAITGSVGVIMHLTRYNRLLNWAKVDSEVFASGSLKDSGDPKAEPTPEQRAYLQGIVDTLAKRFYAVVAKARPKITDWKAVKTGRVFVGERAVGMGLVDGVGDLEAAVKKAKALSGKKAIFTREEMMKMSQLAERTRLQTPVPAPLAAANSVASDLHTLVSMLQEIKSGETAVFEYRLPFRF